MYQKPRNPNKPFMVGTAILAFAVIAIVVLFTLLALQMSSKQKDKPVVYTDTYRIEIGKEFAGDTLTVVINDSILMEQKMPDETVELTVTRFSESGAIYLIRTHSGEQTMYPYNLPEKSARLIFSKKDGTISMKTE